MKNNKRDAIVGIIGGMGPAATVEFMQRVIDATPAEDDRDHIHMIVDNNPKVPSRIKALIDGDGENPGPTIAAMAKRLECAGADFLVMPCNTAHHYHQYAAEAVSIPVSHLVEITLADIKKNQPEIQKIGLLASTAARNIALYEKFCTEAGIEVLYPDDQDKILQVIKTVKSGSVGNVEVDILQSAIDDLKQQGADCLVLACTELSILMAANNSDLPIYDSLDSLAKHVVRQVKIGVSI